MPVEYKPIVWIRGEVKTPPFSIRARVATGVLLRRLQAGEVLGMPHSRPLPAVDPRCNELRIRDGFHSWRLVYSLEPDAVVILEVFSKKTQRTPAEILETCRRRLERYRRA